MFRMIARIEAEHEKRCLKLKGNVDEDIGFYDDDKATVWICKNRGYIHVGKRIPRGCPVCLYPKPCFERRQANY